MNTISRWRRTTPIVVAAAVAVYLVDQLPELALLRHLRSSSSG